MFCYQRLVVMLRILQKGGGKQLRAEFTVQEDASTREFSPQVTIFNLLLLDNVNAQVFWRLDFDDFALREIKKIGRFGKVLRLCQQESPSLPFLCCKSSSRKIVYRKHNIIGADSEKKTISHLMDLWRAIKGDFPMAAATNTPDILMGLACRWSNFAQTLKRVLDIYSSFYQ